MRVDLIPDIPFLFYENITKCIKYFVLLILIVFNVVVNMIEDVMNQPQTSSVKLDGIAVIVSHYVMMGIFICGFVFLIEKCLGK